MLKIKALFFDRFDQSFQLLRKNFLWFFLTIFLYNIYCFIIFIVFIFGSLYLLGNINDFSLWFVMYTIFWIWIFLFLINILFYIVIFLWILKSVKDSVYWKKINILGNLKYWFSKFLNSMKTYWYIFVYVALIPAIIFIIWGLIFLFNMIWNNWIWAENFHPIWEIWEFFNASNYSLATNFVFWLYIMLFSVLLFIIFLVYRWTRVTFALYSATDKNSFDKKDFNYSIKITKNIWWRVFWNIFLLWLIVSIWISSIEYLVWFTIFWVSGWIWNLYNWISEVFSWWNPEGIEQTLENYMNNRSVFYDIIWNLFSIILNTIWTVFIFIFTYLFYLRIDREEKYQVQEKEKM